MHAVYYKSYVLCMQFLGGSGEFMLHKYNFKVLLWLDSREFQRKSKLQERHDFIIMNDELEIEYDRFKENMDIDMHFVPANDFLHYWQDFQANPSTLVAEFGKDYFKMTQEDLDEFYLWMEQSRNEHKLMSANDHSNIRYLRSKFSFV